MIEGNERLIIVVGMAHSGTTILAYLLQQHPDVVCCTDGTEAWILENTWLPLEQAEPIQQLLAKFPDKRLLLKRPWNGVYHGDWMQREMPNARYLYCLRNFEEISKSWLKPNSFVDSRLRDGGPKYQREFYDMCFKEASAFGSRVSHFRPMPHEHLLNNPKRVMAMTTMWLGLSPWRFDVSKVSRTTNIKDFLCVQPQTQLAL